MSSPMQSQWFNDSDPESDSESSESSESPVVQPMVLTMQGDDGSAQDLPDGSAQVDTGPMGACVSIVLLWNFDPTTELYRNVRGFHGWGGFGAINLGSLLANVPDAAETRIIACLGTDASPPESQDATRVTEAHQQDLLVNAPLQIFAGLSQYIVGRDGSVQGLDATGSWAVIEPIA
jgi:hypothetical protein